MPRVCSLASTLQSKCKHCCLAGFLCNVPIVVAKQLPDMTTGSDRLTLIVSSIVLMYLFITLQPVAYICGI